MCFIVLNLLTFHRLAFASLCLLRRTSPVSATLLIPVCVLSVGGYRLIMMDCDWNPAVDRQAMSRIWRDGQTRVCHVYRLVTNNSIEQAIFQVCVRVGECVSEWGLCLYVCVCWLVIVLIHLWFGFVETIKQTRPVVCHRLCLSRWCWRIFFCYSC